MRNHGTTAILAISGSLRRASMNSRLIDEAQKVAPESMRFDVFDQLGALPHFNQDHEFPPPEAVKNLRDCVREADGLLIATPEYNSSVPGVLKNGLDWLSRPSDDGKLVLRGKPVAIVGASEGLLGTARAQSTLRQILHKVDASVVRQPEFLLPRAHLVFDQDGFAEGSATAALLRQVLDQLDDLVTAARHR